MSFRTFLAFSSITVISSSMSVVSAFGGGATNFNVNGANIGRISGVNADGSSPHRTSTFISHQRFYRNSNQGNTLLYESVASDGDDDGEKIDVLKSQQAKMKSKIANDRVEYPAHILDPFPQAADPSYATTGPVGQNSFVVSRMGGPTAEELTNENILLIVERRSNVTDLEVNTLVWKCLGYRFHTSSSGSGGEWRPDEVFPNWKERFPEPPDLIGMQRIYSKEVDSPSLKNNQHLVRSVPDEFKQSLKKNLKPLGFTGYKVSELTPNLTRRAQCSNWLLYYRDELFGYTLEELKERRLQRRPQEEQEQGGRTSPSSPQNQSPSSDDQQQMEQRKAWKPPVKEVF